MPSKNLADGHAASRVHDLQYYAWEAIRIDNVALRLINQGLGETTLTTGRSRFDEAAPYVRELRNSLTHAEERPRPDDYHYFDTIVRLHDDGTVTYMLDPRYQTHDMLLELSKNAREVLESFEAGPPPE